MFIGEIGFDKYIVYGRGLSVEFERPELVHLQLRFKSMKVSIHNPNALGTELWHKEMNDCISFMADHLHIEPSTT